MRLAKTCLIGLILLALIALNVFTSPLLAQSFDQKPIDQSRAVALYNSLIDSIYSENLARSSRPSFGGAFIEGEHLIILDKEYETGVGNLYEIQNDPFVEVRKCKYSYDELYDVFTLITDEMLNNPSSKIIKCSIVDDLNLVDVTILGNNSIDSFVQSCNIDSNILNIRFTQMENQFAKTLYPGGKIWMYPYPISMGYRAKKNGKVGFVTAAHGASLNAQIYDYDNTIIGTCTDRHLGGSVDASFIEITGNFTPSNQTATYNNIYGILSPIIDSPPVGTIINKVGMKTFHTYGTITSTNTSVTLYYNDGASSVVLTNLTQTSANVSYGDSGGVFYTYYPDSQVYKICGITTAFNTSTGDSFYCKAGLINSSLGLTLY